MVVRKCTICDRRFKKTEHFKRHERSRHDVLSRHAKGHNAPGTTAANGAKNTRQPSAPSDQSSHHRSSTIPIDGQGLIPGLSADTPAVSNLPVTPHGLNLSSAPNLPPSSLDFLADISTHQARTEPEVNSLMVDGQQAYFGWNDVAAADQSPYRTIFDPTPNDMLQLWLEPRTDGGSNHGSLDMGQDANFGLVGETAALSPERQNRPSVGSSAESSNYIPNERFAKVQRYWLAPSNNTGRLMNSLWRDVAGTDLDNVFAIHPAHSFNNTPSLVEGLRHGLDEECRHRLYAVFGHTHLQNTQFRSPANGSLSHHSSGSVYGAHPSFPPAEIFDMALDLYFRNFHPLTAQRHGMFAATEGQILDMSLFEAVPDIETRWKAWSKVESVKRCLPDLQLQIASKYGEVLTRLNPNAAVMWHNMCMALTADIQIFDLAAGRSGPGPARRALDDIAAWAQTPAARRACLHAAHIYKAMTNRKASDHTMFHSVFSLFSAALVLGLYVFMVPNPSELQAGGTSIELLDDIDWDKVGTEGFTSFMEPRGSQSFSPSDDPAVNFIRNGGTVYLRGVPFQGGYQSARRILLDYAGLLKDAGKWSVRKFSYVLHIMSDVLLDVE
ncbi:hypothetical protein ATERTT37_005575 [Aspergillus terreus]